jgi:hypothetical protein
LGKRKDPVVWAVASDLLSEPFVCFSKVFDLGGIIECIVWRAVKERDVRRGFGRFRAIDEVKRKAGI